MRLRLGSCAAGLITAWVTSAFAQPSPPTPPAAEVSVDDPMLAPVPMPEHVITSWRDAVSTLRAQSTDLRIAMAQARQAAALTRGALAQYLPTIAATGSYTHQLITRENPAGVPATDPVTGELLPATTTAPVPNIGNGRLRARQSVFDLAALDRIGIDKVAEEAAQLTVEDRKRTLLLALADQILAVVAAERTSEVTRSGLRVALEQAAIIRKRRELGGGTVLDVVRADENAETARAALVAADEALRRAREALGIALGTSYEIGVAPELDINGIAADVTTACRPVASIDERPDIAAARSNYEVARRNVRNAWLTLAPTVIAQSTVNATTIVPVGYPNPTWNVAGLLTVPIWDGGTTESMIRSAHAAEDVAALELDRQRRTALVQLADAKRSLDVANTADTVARRQRELTARDEQLTQVSYAAGNSTTYELVTASEAHRQAELNLVISEFNVVRSRLAAVVALARCPL